MAQTNYQRIFSFGPAIENGSSPRGNLTLGSDGKLYGVTYSGGSNQWGTIFTVARSGAGFQVLHHFDTPTLLPVSGLVEGTNSSLFGTVYSGGSNNDGVIYRIEKNGTGYTLLHHFNAAVFDGESPNAELLSATDGYLYGTTSSGGSNNFGTVFRILPSGADYSTVYHLSGTNGSAPYAALVEGTDGFLYGTTRMGGSSNFGVVFSVSKTGGSFSVLRSFRGKTQSDGKEALAKLVQGTDGFLYGTTYAGGNNDFGTIFKVNTNGSGYSVLHHCQYAANNGVYPNSGLVQAHNGLLYGTMPTGGQTFGGIIYRIGTTGGFSILRSFTGSNGDGTEPFSPLLQTTEGDLFGATYSGGDYAASNVKGVLFKLFAAGAPGTLSITGTSPAGVQLSLTGGAAEKLYTIEKNSQLAATGWQTVGSAAAGINGSLQITDPQPPAAPIRFYRAVSQ